MDILLTYLISTRTFRFVIKGSRRSSVDEWRDVIEVGEVLLQLNISHTCVVFLTTCETPVTRRSSDVDAGELNTDRRCF